MTSLRDLDVLCFGRLEAVPIAAWETATFSQRALITSIVMEIQAIAGREKLSVPIPEADSARQFITAAAQLLPTLPKNKGYYFDASRFTGDEDYARLARHAVTGFYAKKNPHGRPIDIDSARVQIEAFGHQNASFRIAVLYAQKPSFLPLNTSFHMAHNLFLRRSGELTRSEPVYRSANLDEGVSEASLPATSQGFFPGDAAFRESIDRIDSALRAVGKVRQSPPPPPPPKEPRRGFFSTLLHRLSQAAPPPPRESGPVIEVSQGLLDLERYAGSIIEKAKVFRVILDSARTQEFAYRFGPSTFISFEIDKESGSVSPLKTQPYTPPSLC